MANIDKNLLDTAQLGRQIANSNAGQAPRFDPVMDEIYGSRTEEFGADMLEDAAGTSGAVAFGSSAIEAGGLGVCGLIAIILAALFFISLIMLSLMPMFTKIPPLAAPPMADAIRAAQSEETIRALAEEQAAASVTPAGPGIRLNPSQQLNKAILEHEGAFKGMIPDGRPSLLPNPAEPSERKSSALDEGALQAQRLSAITSGNIDRYNQLIEDHIALYKQHGIDPCQSGFFPQGCQ